MELYAYNTPLILPSQSQVPVGKSPGERAVLAREQSTYSQVAQVRRWPLPSYKLPEPAAPVRLRHSGRVFGPI